MLYRATLAASLLSSSAYAGSTGTDDFGNTITGSDINSSVKSDLFFDISDIANELVSGNDAAAQSVDLGMTFSYYGRDFTALTFSTNGYISTSAFDVGNDLTNDVLLPTAPSTGEGGRIYTHHDDLEAVIYGGFFNAADNPFGVDAYIVQYDACHFNCAAGIDVTVQYNVALLTDGTVIIAHNLAGDEEGGSATVGIQSESFDDGIAYLANEAGGIVDGQTIVVIPTDSGLSTDIRNLATEAGIAEITALAGNAHGHLAAGQADSFVSQAGDTFDENDAMSTRLGRYQPWINAGVLHSATGDATSVETTALYVQGGVDLHRTDRFAAGIGLGFSRGSGALGAASVDLSSETFFLYGETTYNDWTIGSTLSYGRTHYDNLETTFLGDINAEGERSLFSLSATKDIPIRNDMTISPRLNLMAGRERIDDWATGDDLSRNVDEAFFRKTEMTGKISRPFGNLRGGTGFVLAGADYLTVDGNSNDALFSAGYENKRVGGVAGIGVEELAVGNMILSLDLTASGITNDGYTLNGGLTLEF